MGPFSLQVNKKRKFEVENRNPISFSISLFILSFSWIVIIYIILKERDIYYWEIYNNVNNFLIDIKITYI